MSYSNKITMLKIIANASNFFNLVVISILTIYFSIKLSLSSFAIIISKLFLKFDV